MKIELKKLSIQDFKGIQNFVLTVDGKSVNVYGDNATGKTTLVDAFQWVLFDKNSEGNSKFGIKPLNPDGSEKHYLETTVELTLGVDSNDITLKKVYKEKWSKKTGEEEKEFSGHTTDYYINDTPKSQKDYKAKVSEIVDEEVFKMLTNVLYFNSIDWKKRRSLIMSLCPNVSHDEVIATNPELEPLKPYLDKKSVEDIQTTEKANKTKLNDLLKTLPARIDELSKIDYSMIEGKDPEEISLKIKQNTDKLQEIANKKSALNNGSEIINLELEIKKLQVERAQLSSYASPKAEKLDTIRREGALLKNKKIELEGKQRGIEDKIANLKKTVDYNENLRNKLYEDYDAEMAKVFTADKCTYCGQALPADKVEQLQKEFNAKRAAALDNIVTRGKLVAADIEQGQKDLKASTEALEAVKQELVEVENQINAKLYEYDTVSHEPDVNPNQSKLDELTTQMNKLAEKMKVLKTSFVVNPYEEEETALQNEMYQLNRMLVMFDQKAANEERISELIEQRKKASSDLSQSELILALCDKYIVAKTNLLESHINDNFSIVKFKMFNTQVNGGIEETCVATVDGTPFGDLNNAMKINAGLDIIKGLQKVYGVTAPIFIDNAESVTKFIDMPGTQMIKLYVSETDKTLRVE